MVPNANNSDLMCPEESNELHTNSLHDFAQLAGYLQTRVTPGVAPSANDNCEEQLSPDLALFMQNM